MRKTTAILLSSLLITLGGCARTMNPDVYTESSAAGKVLEGTLISARQVTIKGNDKLANNTLGILAGGATGAVAGSAIGKGAGNSLATVGVALVGGAIGAVVQDKLNTSQGYEYLVKLDKKYIDTQSEAEVKITHVSTDGKDLVGNSLKSSIDLDAKTDIISVIQAEEKPLIPGSRVYVIYNDDRPRVSKM